MGSQPFIGRKLELERLATTHQSKAPSLVVVKGRRRVGKSRLIQEFAQQHPKSKLYSFAGLAPQENLTEIDQRNHFAKQLSSLTNVPPFLFHDWSDALDHFSTYLRSGDIVLFDEISWMGSRDPSFVSKLKAWWDKQKIDVTLVLCGSVSTWIEANILNSTAFFGRINLTLTIEPFSITESVHLLKAVGFRGSSYDTYVLLSILGGIPWYLEQVSSGLSGDETIKRLCFEKDGLLVLEFDRIFHDLFNTRGSTYKKILMALIDGSKTLAETRKIIEFSHSGTFSQLMENLIVAGFVSKQNLWSFKTTLPLKQSLYRVCDPYMRFYLKVIEPQRRNIDKGGFHLDALAQLPGFEAHVGLQCEFLLLQNRDLLLKSLGVANHDVVVDGPYRQSKTSTQKGCQIDYLVQTRTNNLLICEFKFKRKELGQDIINQMKKKIKALKVPRGFAAIPVLFHLGGVASSVATDNYFYRIIDISDFLGT